MTQQQKSEPVYTPVLRSAPFGTVTDTGTGTGLATVSSSGSSSGTATIRSSGNGTALIPGSGSGTATIPSSGNGTASIPGSGNAVATVPGPRIGMATVNVAITPAARLAHDLAARLRAGLASAGFEVDRDFPHLRGDTTASDEPFLTLGRLRPNVVERLLTRLH